MVAMEHEDLKGVDPKVCQHKIPLILNAKPILLQRYQMNPNYAEKVKEEIDNLIKVGFIAEVESSDWFFSIMVVPKKNGKLRVCVDYRKLHAQTIMLFKAGWMLLYLIIVIVVKINYVFLQRTEKR